MRLICLLLLAVVTLKSVEANKVSCKNEEGENVDWWHMYLMSSISGEAKNLRYLYVTSKDYGEWMMSEHSMDHYKSLPSATLDPLYANDNILLAAYNDEFPNGTTFEMGGAAKGVIASDGKTGMWLVHSIPKYPTVPDRRHPIPDLLDAHSLLCLTLDAEGVRKVGDLLVLYEPHFYYMHNPLGLYMFPNLQRALSEIWLTDGINEKDVKLRTLDGKKFRLFGRNDRSLKELYADIVAPGLGVNLFVRSNRPSNSENNLPNSCHTSKRVYNVKEVVCPHIHKYITSWEDHSKWAVSQATGIKVFLWRIFGSDWICVGDLNRWHTHQKRGGGAVCHKSSRVSDHYRKLLHSYDECN